MNHMYDIVSSDEPNDNPQRRKPPTLFRSISDVIRTEEECELPIYLSKRQPPHRRAEHRGNRRPTERRILIKHGKVNTILINHDPMRSVKYLKDLVNTLINSRWRCILMVFSFSYVVNWLFFATMFTIGAHSHGDLEDDGYDRRTCINGTNTFIGFFLLAVETQTTIGYGSRVINEDCPEIVFLMSLQILLGVGVHGAMVGVVYAKMIRPKRRISMSRFSKKALICQRDGQLCLIFRASDIHYSRLVCTKFDAYLVESRHTSPEGESLNNFYWTLKLEPSGFFLWPLTVVHVIDATSPLYNISARDLLIKRFEIIVTCTGSSETTAQISQLKTSYLSTDILWGHRFVECVQFDSTVQKYVVDHKKFNETVVVDTPLCSAQRLHEVIDEIENSASCPNESYC